MQTSFQAHRPFLRPPLGRTRVLGPAKKPKAAATEERTPLFQTEAKPTTHLPLLAQQASEEDHETQS